MKRVAGCKVVPACRQSAGWWLLVLLPVLLPVVLLGGCKSGSRAPAPHTQKAEIDDQAYPVRGTVISSDPASGELKLQHKAVPGLMGAMTMSYHLQDPAALSELHPGDVITAAIVTEQASDGTSSMRLKNVVIVSQAKPDYVPAVQYHVPTPGDSVPDFTMLNQFNRTIDLDQFHGKVLVMTFIYTRCPLSDYCVRMSRNFAQIDKALEAEPKLRASTHLLSVSFDPAYDTPPVLKSYGEAYTGRYVRETFKHWDFAAPPADELPKVEQYFDVGVTPAQNGTLQHSLATLVIGKDGKVVAFWPSNDWTVAEVMAKIESAGDAKTGLEAGKDVPGTSKAALAEPR